MAIRRHSIWWDQSHPDFAYQSQLPPYADIVIIGAGFAGVSTAFWAAKLAKNSTKPVRILVLEAGPHPAFKASGRMNGNIYLGSNKPATQVAEQLTESVAQKLYYYSAGNNVLLESMLKKSTTLGEFNGGLRMASTAKEVVELEDSKNLLQKWNFHPVYFDHNKSQHVVIAPLVKGSLYIPGEGMFDPFRFVNEMVRTLRQHSVLTVYGARVVKADNNAEGAPQVHLDNGHVIVAGKVVHANAQTAPWDRLHEAIVHRRETVICTAPLPESVDGTLLPLMPIELNQGVDSVRLHERSIIITGGKAGLRKADPDEGVLDDTALNQRILDHLDATLVRNFPFTNALEVNHTWTYIETDSHDGLPFVGELPQHSNHFVNVAHGRNKFGLAFMNSKNLAERLLRYKVNEADFAIFAPKRLTRGE